MGLYLNPPDQSKESYLHEYGHPIPASAMSWPRLVRRAMIPVCLIDNGGFTAAAIAYSPDEFDQFHDDLSPRPRWWYSVPLDRLTADGHLPNEIAVKLASYVQPAQEE